MHLVIFVPLLLCAIRWTHAFSELVWIEDINGDHDRRHLEMGLPDRLKFNIKRQDVDQVKLDLQENKRLNVNAPVFTTVMEDGKQKAVQVEIKPITGTKFYQDKRTAAAVKVSCQTRLYGPCQRLLEGSLDIEGDSYEIKPSPTLRTLRAMSTFNSDVPHIIERIVQLPEPKLDATVSRMLGVHGTDSKWIPEEDNLEAVVRTNLEPDFVGDVDEEAPFHDYVIPPDEFDDRGLDNLGRMSQRPKTGTGRSAGNEANLKRLLDIVGDVDEEAPFHDYVIPPDEFDDRGLDNLGRMSLRPKIGTGRSAGNEANPKRVLDIVGDVDEEAPFHDYVIPPDEFDDRGLDNLGRMSLRPKTGTGRSTGNEANLKRVLDFVGDVDEEAPFHDYMIPPDNEDDDGKVNENERKEEMFRTNNKSKRDTGKLFALEVLVVIDPSYWKKYFDKTSPNNGMDQDEATMYYLRERMAHIMNGVSLRFESIDDPEMNIYVTVCGYLYYKTIDNSNPLSPSVKIPVVNGIEHADSDVYIYGLDDWALTLTNIPESDHIMVMSGYELYYGDNTKNTAVLGVAYIKGACGRFKVSVQQDQDFFGASGVIAHEIGHNVGAYHDGTKTSAACPAADKFLMNPHAASFRTGDAYSLNPWRFSTCSVEAFKAFIGSGRCLLNTGAYYDQTEWNKHNMYEPGEVHSPEEQCKLIRGENSKFCKNLEDENICRYMSCYEPSNKLCYNTAAARGTPCGIASLNKWCIDGQCIQGPVRKRNGKERVWVKCTDSEKNATTTMATTTPTTTTTTAAPTTKTTTMQGQKAATTSTPAAITKTKSTRSTTSPTKPRSTTTPTKPKSTTTPTKPRSTTVPTKLSPESCTNKGWRRWSCMRVSKYFYSVYSYRPSYWCQDSYWQDACCALCEAATRTTRTKAALVTTTPVPTTSESCVDIGYYAWSCAKVADYFRKTYSLLPKKWCLDPDWNEKCCAYCAENGV